MKVDLNKISGPYAEALLEFAQANKALEEIQKDAVLVLNFMMSSSELKKFLDNPVIARDVKKRFVKDLFSDKIGDNTLKFVLLLIDRKRIDILENIFQKFQDLCHEARGIEIVKVTSPIELSVDNQREIVKQMKFLRGSEKRIRLALKIDTKILGGYILEFGSTMVDISVRGQLTKISTLLGA